MHNPEPAIATLPSPQSAVTTELALRRERPRATAIVKNFIDFKNYGNNLKDIIYAIF